MRAGIFKRQDNGKHIYVRKDRSIGAIELTDVHPCDSEYKVSERVGGKYVNVPEPNGEYFATVAERVADAPKGVNDCVKALGEYVDSLKRSAEEANDDDFSLNVDGNDSARETMREGTLVPPADAPEGDPVDLDPELAAYHGEADESVREAINLLPDNVSPAQSLHEFVAERLHRKADIYAKFTDAIHNGQAHAERLLAMPKALEAPYGALPPQTVFLSTPSDAKWFVEEGERLHEQMVNDFLTDRIEFVPGVSDEVLWHNDEERERLARERLARGEFRLCHAAAARKHKKKRDRYVWWHPVFGCYAWKKVEVAA